MNRGPVNHPTDTSNALVQGGDGSLWRTAGLSDIGEQLYVLNGVDPDTCARWVKVEHSELVALVGGLTPVNVRPGVAR